MCGISGILLAKRNLDRRELSLMVNAMQHRGPDDQGIWCNQYIGLGHNRLSIIDLSSAGHQPMVSEGKHSVIVFNGEIYNFREIRASLEKKGYVFQSKTDTEVVLNAYQQHDVGCLDLLEGMFAFAIWATDKRVLFLARDRLGKKPLYYYYDGQKFAFSSEIKALLQLEWVPRELDLAAIKEYLTLQYIPAPNTVFRKISKLLPGHFLKVKRENDHLSLSESCYWDLSEKKPFSATDNSTILEEAEQLLIHSVKKRLIADVEIGVLLSGGIDSSLIASIAQKQSPRPLKTFSVKFDDSSLSEEKYSRLVTKELNTDHYELVADEVTPDMLFKVIDQIDEPMADPACIPTYMIASLASKHVKVVLSGEGADEIFGGYSHYLHEKLFAPLLRFSPAVRDAIASGLVALPLKTRAVKRLSQVFRSSPDIGLNRWVQVFSEHDVKAYCSDNYYVNVQDHNPFEAIQAIYRSSTKKSLLEKGIKADIKTWLPEDLLMKVDKMTMAHSLEARTPYLDNKLVEFVTGLDIEYKISSMQTKNLLKRIAKKYLPDIIIYRPKQGFEVPLETWLLENFRDIAEEFFDKEKLQDTGLFNPDTVAHDWIFLKQNRKALYPRRLWLIFFIMVWLHRINIRLH